MTATVWRYSLPSVKGDGWSVAFVDSIGCLSVLSDWGNYGYRWPNGGWGPKDFRAFLLQCDEHYILKKIAPRNEYDGEATVVEVKRCILEARRSREWNAEHARREWKRLDDFGNLDSREEFAMWVADSEIVEAYRLAQTSPPSDALGFMKHCWPRLRDAISDQLAAEQLREGARP